MIQLLLLTLLFGSACSEVVALTNENSHIIQSGEWFIKAYAPWCGACRSIAPAWLQLGAWAEDKEYNIAEIDITVGYTLSNQLLVTRIPTLFHVKDGIFTQYQGPRTVDAWKKFLLENESESLEPMSWYRRPGSITMTLFGYLISFAIKVNGFHNYLTDDVKVPVAVSVAILIGAPIVLMITLLLFTVWLIHKIWGKPKPAHAIGKQRAENRTVSQPQSEELETTSDPVEDKKDQ